MLEESGIYTIHVFRGTWKAMHNTQTRSQSKSNLTAIYLSYIDKKWDQNGKGNDKSPKNAEKSQQ